MSDPTQSTPAPGEPQTPAFAPADDSEPVYPHFDSAAWAQAPSPQIDYTQMDAAALADSITAAPDPTPPRAAYSTGQTGAGTYSVPLPAVAPITDAQDRFWGSASHFAGVLGPIPVLIIWLTLRRRGRFVNQEGKEALNFQLSAWILISALFLVGGLTLPILIGYALIPLVIVVQFAEFLFAIIGGSKSSGGRPYRYPFTYRFIK
ncbi:DUF4870 domain-containing protein [Mycetocola saprophilus]|uniref:DUF4870 domain-containing protein n=1 Tax=Mycetocola saprophilus TaxID=76636 RepID=UPI003BEF618C